MKYCLPRGRAITVLVLAVLLHAAFTAARAADDLVYQELKLFKDSIIKAFNRNKVEAVLPLLSSDIVLTTENNRVARKIEGVKEFLNELLGSPDGQLEKFSIDDLVIDDVSILQNGSSVIALGGAVLSYYFKSGEEYTYPVRWTATLVSVDGRWTLAALHNSVNFTDNFFIDNVRKSLNIYIIGAFMAGIGAGYVIVTRKFIK